MTNWIINSAVLTSFGEYRYEPISLEEARAIVRADEHQSAIGHAETAAVLTEQLGVEVKSNRISISMQPGERAIIFRLKDRLPENAVLSRQDLSSLPFELGLLTRLK